LLTALDAPAASEFIAAHNNPLAVDKLFFAILLLLRHAWKNPGTCYGDYGRTMRCAC
jgi:hypothetical protein